MCSSSAMSCCTGLKYWNIALLNLYLGDVTCNYAVMRSLVYRLWCRTLAYVDMKRNSTTYKALLLTTVILFHTIVSKLLLLLCHEYSWRGSKSFPSAMNITGLQVPTRSLRDYPLFHYSPPFKNCPAATCTPAAVSLRSDFDVFTRQITSFSQILPFLF